MFLFRWLEGLWFVVVYQWWNDDVEVLQMEIFLPTKLVGEDIDENLEIFRSFGEILHQIGDYVVQMSTESTESILRETERLL